MTWKSIVAAGARGYKRIQRCKATLNNGQQCQSRPEASWFELKVKPGYCRRHRQERRPAIQTEQTEQSEQQDQ